LILTPGFGSDALRNWKDRPPKRNRSGPTTVILSPVELRALLQHEIERKMAGANFMRRWETIAVFTPVVAAVGFVGWALASTYYENKARNAPAIAAGFHDSEEMNAARAVGLTDPLAYRTRVEDEKIKAASEQALREKNIRAAEAEGAALLRERNRNPADRLTIKGMTWSLAGFKNVGMVNVTIENGNDFAVKDVGIRCYFNGKSGTQLSSNNHTIFDTIPAKGRKAFKEVNVGFINSQSATASCNVETAGRF
jgi:hypothetical protein